MPGRHCSKRAKVPEMDLAGVGTTVGNAATTLATNILVPK